MDRLLIPGMSMILINLCSMVGAAVSIPANTDSDNPIKNANITWHMRSLDGSDDNLLSLKVNGQVEIGQKLEDDEYNQSLKRGGDGYVSVFNGNGWLTLDTNRANSIRPKGNDVTLYIRTWIGPNGNGTLFFSDFLTLAIYPTGLALGYAGVKTPDGKVYRVMPLGIIERNCWSDLVIRIGKKKLDFICNGTRKASIPLNQNLCMPFDDVLQIGSFVWSGPDLYVHPQLGLTDTKIDTVALWDSALPNNQIAFLSGTNSLNIPQIKSKTDKAILDYNAFFDASLNLDVALCDRLWRSLIDFADQDSFRPAYHLTPPIGAIFDPAGAYYYGGRYHVFSYRNIMNILHYCSLDHYVSNDLVHWSEWPIGPWADSDLDVYGIWLMNHFIDDNGIPSVIYTAHGIEGKCGILARSHDNLLTYKEKQPVLTKYHHDGHVWKDGSIWYTITTKMTKGTRPGNLGDGVMLWSSHDLKRWKELGEIFTQPKISESTADGDKAGFTEFPYLISFGKKDVLMLGSHPVRYWVGKFDKKTYKFIPDKTHGNLLDYANSFHCFNPLCVDKKGPSGSSRRIIMALYAGLSGESDGLQWLCTHAMSRVLTLDGDHLHQEPVPEMQSLRSRHYTKNQIALKPDKSGYIEKRGDLIEIIAEFDPGTATCFGLKIRLSDDGKSFARIYFNTATSEYGVDGRVPDTHNDLNLKPDQGCPTYLQKGKPVVMHVFLDKLMIETFVNGQTCTTSAIDKDSRYNGIDLFCEGGTAQCNNLDIWDMKPAKSTLK